MCTILRFVYLQKEIWKYEQILYLRKSEALRWEGYTTRVIAARFLQTKDKASDSICGLWDGIRDP